MTKNQSPDSLDALLDEASGTLRSMLERAHAAGYQEGQAAAAQHILAAAKGMAEGGVAALAQSIRPKTPMAYAGGHSNAADNRRFPYGAVANAFRAALRRAAIYGLNRMELIERVSEELGQSVAGMNHADTIKRLKRTGELQVDNGIYKAGPTLRLDEAEGAPSGTTSAGAPEADEGIRPSSEASAIDLYGPRAEPA